MAWVIRLAAVAGLAIMASRADARVKLLDCARAPDPGLCRQSQEQVREELPQASRDYGAMRNVAFCLWDGCDGAVERDRRQSCQIRRRIMDMHKRKVDRGDEGHFAACVQAGY
jgi:hypothetical protein